MARSRLVSIQVSAWRDEGRGTVIGEPLDDAAGREKTAGRAPEELTNVELAARLRLTLGRLNRRVRQHGPQALSASQASTLASVDALGPVRLGDLAAHEGVTAPTQSRLVASLESQGLLRRTPDSEDRRATLLAITTEGRRQLDQLRGERSAFLVEQLSRLSGEQRAALVAAIDALEVLAESPCEPQ